MISLKMSSDPEEHITQVQENVSDEETQINVDHWTTVERKADTGKFKGQIIKHFRCSYCVKPLKYFQGPSNGSILKHRRKSHPRKCPEILPTQGQISSRGFFDNAKIKEPFNEDIFMGKLLKWIVKTDQPFSVVDNEHFEDLLEYLRKDLTVKSKTTIMRRLDELYDQKKHEMKERLNSFKSKYSITCDVWTSKNQLSFFGFTIHYINDDWQMKEQLLAFKYLEGEHDGESLSRAFIDVLEDYGIADRLLGVTADNASKNSTMMAHMEAYYHERYPEADFNVACLESS
jgi:hypothetical protein